MIVDGTDGADNVKVGSAGGDVLVSGLYTDVQVTGAESANDSVDVNTLGGDDTINTGLGISGPAAVNIDGGTGMDTEIYSGTPFDDTIGIGRDGANVAAFGTTGTPAVATAVESLDVKGLGGDDTIMGQNGIAGLTHLTIDGGAGDDTIQGGDGDDTLNGGAGSDSVNGGRGSDVALLGGGQDTFTWNPGDGSDIVEGQGGNDTLDFNGSNAPEKIDLSANGSRVRLFRDVANVTMDVNGIEGPEPEHARERRRGDGQRPDRHRPEDRQHRSQRDPGIRGRRRRCRHRDRERHGGRGSRSRRALGAQVQTTGLVPRLSILGSEPASDTLQINTLAGDDAVTVGSDVSQLISPLVDLGADQ